LGLSVKSMPVPVSERTWGELEELSAMIKVPVRGPPADGVKTTCMVQADPMARFAPQLLVPAAMKKSPVMTGLWSDSGALLLLVSVMVAGAADRLTPVAGKLRVLVGERETPGGAIPLPLRGIVCARYSSEMVSAPVAGPMVCGWKETAMEQVECPFSELPQELTTEKLPLVIWAAMRVSGRSPELVRVICCDALEVVRGCAAKVSDACESASVAGDVPVPMSDAVWVPASSVMVKLPVRVPEAVGVKAIETVQPELASSVAAQVFAVRVKSPVIDGGWRVM
jgi:hypothetical protein